MCTVCAQTSTPTRSRAELRQLVEVRKIEALIRKDRPERIAAEMQDLLLMEWDDRSRQAIEDALGALSSGDGPLTAADIDEVLGELNEKLGQSFSEAVRGRFSELVVESYADGRGVEVSVAYDQDPEAPDTVGPERRPGRVGTPDPVPSRMNVGGSFNVQDRQALAWMQEEGGTYWIRNHYERNLQDDIRELGEQVLREGVGRRRAGEAFREEMESRFGGESQAYWENLSNHVVTRSRCFGQVERYQEGGIQRLELMNPLDDRTSEVCRILDGTTIPVSDAASHRDRLTSTSRPEDVIEMAPWPDAGDLTGAGRDRLPPEDLVAKGVVLPPFHFGCRTRTVAAVETEIDLDEI